MGLITGLVVKTDEGLLVNLTFHERGNCEQLNWEQFERSRRVTLGKKRSIKYLYCFGN